MTTRPQQACGTYLNAKSYESTANSGYEFVTNFGGVGVTSGGQREPVGALTQRAPVQRYNDRPPMCRLGSTLVGALPRGSENPIPDLPVPRSVVRTSYFDSGHPESLDSLSGATCAHAPLRTAIFWSITHCRVDTNLYGS